LTTTVSHLQEGRFIAARLAASASLELTPGEVDDHIGGLVGALPSGTRIFLTALAHRPPREQLAAAETVHAHGFAAVPHIAARAYRDLRELERQLTRLVSTAAVREVLVVAGGQARPAGEITSALDILRAGVVQASGVKRIGVAGYPEGIRGIPLDEVARALAEKNQLAVDQGLDMRVVTQFAFDANTYLDWERAARAAGNRLPVTVGLPGVVSIRKLLRFAAKCGIGASADILRKQARNILKLVSSATWRPDEVIAGIGQGISSDSDCLIDALHLFTFGNVVATGDWLQALISEGSADGRHSD
jgi:methylenetetrahydrofolate reductase (NADPH)